MARAYSVHVVISASGIIYGTWTVKHECQQWLEGQSEEFRSLLEVRTFRDGISTVDHAMVGRTVDEFLK